jgi:hypothetical protein
MAVQNLVSPEPVRKSELQHRISELILAICIRLDLDAAHDRASCAWWRGAMAELQPAGEPSRRFSDEVFGLVPALGSVRVRLDLECIELTFRTELADRLLQRPSILTRRCASWAARLILMARTRPGSPVVSGSMNLRIAVLCFTLALPAPAVAADLLDRLVVAAVRAQGFVCGSVRHVEPMPEVGDGRTWLWALCSNDTAWALKVDPHTAGFGKSGHASSSATSRVPSRPAGAWHACLQG